MEEDFEAEKLKLNEQKSAFTQQIEMLVKKNKDLQSELKNQTKQMKEECKLEKESLIN